MKAEQKAQLIAKAKAQAALEGIEFFQDPFHEAYATVRVENHVENWKIWSRDFYLWVAQTLYDLAGGVAIPRKFIKEMQEEFEMHAICKGPTHDLFVRVAESSGRLLIDLGDKAWRSIEVTASGWRILDEPAVKFHRQIGMSALPDPVRGTRLPELLSFLNVHLQSEQLLLTWLTSALRATGPYPIMALSGVQGAGKSTITRVLRSLIDPSLAALTSTPRSERDLAIAASNSHLVAMDNLSSISENLSDAMCRVATGGAHRERKYYTNDGQEVIFTYCRPLIVNGIEELPQRPDLLDRSVLIHVEPITQDQRRDEKQFWSQFEAARPALFGAVLDVISAGLRRVEAVDLPVMPRMADFARWGVAVEASLGYAPGSFLAAYINNIGHASDVAVESSPIATILIDFLHQSPQFQGPALKLLKLLNQFHSDTADTARKHPKWPRSANALSAEIARVEPNLGKLGITVKRDRNHNGRFITLELQEGHDRHIVTPSRLNATKIAA